MRYFLAPGCVLIISDKVINRVVTENLRDAHSQLQDCKTELWELKGRLKDLKEVLEETRIDYEDTRWSQDIAKKNDLKERKKVLKKDIRQCEVEIEAQEFSIRYCEAYLDGAHRAEAKRIALLEGGGSGTSEKTQVEQPPE